MAIQFQCPQCSATIKVPDSASGKIGQCPRCQAKLQVPELAIPPQAPPPPPPPPAPPKTSKGPLLGDQSTVFVLPPAGGAAPANAPVAGPVIVPPLDDFPPPPAPTANPQQAREEYEQGRTWLTKPFVPGAGWPAADRAVKHFERAAELDPRNTDYAAQAGIACQESIARFLQSWGTGPMTSIAAFHSAGNLGKQIDKAEGLFRPSGLSGENVQLLLQRANEGLKWYSDAIAADANDAVALCHRAELLRDVGAFGAALEDAKGVLSSPLVPSQTRSAAQDVADFILGEDSPLRKYLTRSDAQQLPPPPGIVVPARTPAPKLSPPPRPAADDSLSRIVINTGETSPFIGPPGSLEPTQAEFPTIAPGAPRPAGSPSVAARLRQKKGGGVLRWLIPVLLGAILVVLGMGYLYLNRPTFTGPLTGEDLGNNPLRKTIYRNEFGVPDDRVDALLAALRDKPRRLPTELREVDVTASASGLDVTLRAGPKGHLVRVDLRSNPHLAEFCKIHAEALEAPLAPLHAHVLKQFVTDFEASRSAGMEQGNLGEYLDTLGGDLLVHGLGYHVKGVSGTTEFPCIYEDLSGAVYFLIPKGVREFDVVERRHNDELTIFTALLKFNVTVAAPAPPKPPAAATEPPAAESPADEPAADAPTDPATPDPAAPNADGQPAMTKGPA